jgi:hypothetical protein
MVDLVCRGICELISGVIAGDAEFGLTMIVVRLHFWQLVVEIL